MKASALACTRSGRRPHCGASAVSRLAAPRVRSRPRPRRRHATPRTPVDRPRCMRTAAVRKPTGCAAPQRGSTCPWMCARRRWPGGATAVQSRPHATCFLSVLVRAAPVRAAPPNENCGGRDVCNSRRAQSRVLLCDGASRTGAHTSSALQSLTALCQLCSNRCCCRGRCNNDGNTQPARRRQRAKCTEPLKKSANHPSGLGKRDRTMALHLAGIGAIWGLEARARRVTQKCR